MKVTIFDAYTEETSTFQGEPDQVRNQLNARYQFLKRYENDTLQDDLERLSEQQALFLNIEA
jgi:hypothetical protein